MKPKTKGFHGSNYEQNNLRRTRRRTDHGVNKETEQVQLGKADCGKAQRRTQVEQNKPNTMKTKRQENKHRLEEYSKGQKCIRKRGKHKGWGKKTQ